MTQTAASVTSHRSTGLAVRTHGLRKEFAAVVALNDVDFDLRVGEVHGLVGENGAGKSTLVKCLTGVYTPDRGEIEFGNGGRRDALAVIYQELTIVPTLTAAQNVFLGRPHRCGPFVRSQMVTQEFTALAREFDAVISPSALAGSLSVAEQQLLEIMRALQARKRILLMDEPTASLGPIERANLHTLIERLREDGVSVVYISHDLDEVLTLCDRVSVMRNGSAVATQSASQWTKPALVEAMLGTENSMLTQRTRGSVPAGTRALLSVRGLRFGRARMGISFDLRRGEVLGIAGLVGSGRTRLLRSLAGAERTTEGELTLDGERHALPRSVPQALKLGLALAPEDRKGQGLVLTRSAAENIVLTDLSAVARGYVVSESSVVERTEGLAPLVSLPRHSLVQPTRELSGGTQQKVLLAKWLHKRPKVLMLDEPTRGVDVGAKAEIYRLIRAFATEGMGLIIVSSELEEVVALSDRILVLARHEHIATLDGSDASVDDILKRIFRVEQREDEAKPWPS